jgi:hypothetical protein
MKNIGYAFYKQKKNNWIKIKHWKIMKWLYMPTSSGQLADWILQKKGN